MSKIRDLPITEKPREKAFHYGLKSLSNQELLSIILRTGTKESSVLQISQELLDTTGGLAGLARFNLQELSSIKGIGRVKALEILAAMEISRRIAYEQVMHHMDMHQPELLVNWLKKEIGSSMQEIFLVVYLDTMMRFVTYKELFKGTIDSSMVSPREIFKEAILNNSTNILLVHNHPSGCLTPSKQDLMLTKKIVKLAGMMKVHVLDHIIVCNNDFYSFSREGLMEEEMEEFYNQW